MWCNLLYFSKKCANDNDVFDINEVPIIHNIIAPNGPSKRFMALAGVLRLVGSFCYSINLS